MRRLVSGAMLFLLCAAFALPRAAHADAVTQWSLLADHMGRGGANWRTMAIMHMAMHDAWNATLPTYARWVPPEPGEPASSGALPQAAMAAAARRVLVLLHPDQAALAERSYRSAMAPLGEGASRDAGEVLGDAIGAAAVRRRADDGYGNVYTFPESREPGRWRPTPPREEKGYTTSSRPFLMPQRVETGAPPPPELGSPDYLRMVEETRVAGRAVSDLRTDDQEVAAFFWAYQSSQRGFVHLAVTLLEKNPRPGGLAEHARIMSQLAVALADSAIVAWAEKEQFRYWRPITIIRAGGFGVQADRQWDPLIETPAHPEYPSGHAADCVTGATFLARVFGERFGPIVYVAQGGRADSVPTDQAMTMGQHAQNDGSSAGGRRFPTFQAAAEECMMSRIWAGAHLRAANEESRRFATLIVARAVATVPPLSAPSSAAPRRAAAERTR